MKIALVEDNGLHQAQIRQEIQNYFAELNEVCELRVFDNGSDMLDHYYSVGGYDLLLLDIQLPRSLADTFTMPLASMSNVTSICGTPRGAGAMPVSWNLPRVLL